MAKIQEGLSDAVNTFNLNGLDYPKNRYEIYYRSKEILPDGNINQDKIEVGIRSIDDKSVVIQKPEKVSLWVDGSDDAYTTLNGLVAALITFVGFNTPQEGGDMATSSGWAQYGDSKYTESSPLVINSSLVSVIDLDGDTNTLTSQLPEGITDFYNVDTSKITPDLAGDGYSMSISFKGISSSNNGDATIFIDIGGSFNRLFAKSFRFNRGAGVSHEYYFTFNFYALNTFLDNGGLIKVESGQGNTSIYDIVIQIHRTHKGR